MAYDEFTHYAMSRTSLWCPVCGAAEGKGCTEVKGLRFTGHNAFATGNIPRPVVPMECVSAPNMRKDVPPRKFAYTPRQWVQ